MKIEIDTKSYTSQQEILTGEMIARIAELLEEGGIEGERLKELTGKIAFAVTCMIDDVSEVSFDGETAHPYLTFLAEDYETLIHLGGNSYSHEIVYPILNAMFRADT